ncbi:MAG: O-antigen ligase family protein [Candidatus Paceibacterota bacterium]
MLSDLDRMIHKLVLGGIFLLPFLPLIVTTPFFFPFITGKAFFFRLLVQVIFAGYLVLAIRHRKYRPQFSPITWALLVWFVIAVLTSIFGVDPIRSFYSNFERMDGVLTYIHLLLYFVVITSVLSADKLWRWFFQTSLAVSLIVAYYGLAQLNGRIEINQGGVRLDATLGNAAYLASYLLIHIFIAGWLWLKARIAGLALGWHFLYAGIIVLHLFLLYKTATRGAILGLLGGLLVTAFLISLRERHDRRLRLVAGISLASVLLLVGGFILIRDASFIQSSPVLSRFATISPEEKTTKSRFLIWNMAWQGFQEKPIFGWGPGNFRFVFDKYYDPEMYGQEQWFDSSHNVALDWLIAGGVVGFLSFIAIFLALLYALWFKTSLGPAEKSLLTGLIAAYFFQNLFIFDNIVTYYFFFTVLAFIHFHTHLASDEPSESLRRPKSKKREAVIPSWTTAHQVGLAVGLVLIVVLFHLSVTKPALAAARLISSIKYSNEGQLTESLASLDQAVTGSPTARTEAREQIIMFAIRTLPQAEVPDELKTKILQITEREITAGLAENPANVRLYVFAANLAHRLGRLEQAAHYYEQALAFSPNKQTLMFDYSAVLMDKGEMAEALAVVKQAFELAPDFDEARIRYAYLAFLTGQTALAEELLLERFDTLAINHDLLLNLYVTEKRFDLVEEIWRSRLAARPTDLSTLMSYAGSLLVQDKETEAIVALEEARELFAVNNEDDDEEAIKAKDTAKEQIDQAIEAIKAGTIEVNVAS